MDFHSFSVDLHDFFVDRPDSRGPMARRCPALLFRAAYPVFLHPVPQLLRLQAIPVYGLHLKAVVTHRERPVRYFIGGAERAPPFGRAVAYQAVAIAHLPCAGAEADALEVNADFGRAL